MNVEKKIDKAIKELMKDNDLNYEEAKESIIKSWGKYGLRGYGIFCSDETDVLHIEKIDELDIWDCDLDAAQQAELDGIKLIHDIDIPNWTTLYWYKDTFIDTPENRKQLRKELSKYDR